MPGVLALEIPDAAQPREGVDELREDQAHSADAGSLSDKRMLVAYAAPSQVHAPGTLRTHGAGI